MKINFKSLDVLDRSSEIFGVMLLSVSKNQRKIAFCLKQSKFSRVAFFIIRDLIT